MQVFGLWFPEEFSFSATGVGLKDDKWAFVDVLVWVNEATTKFTSSLPLTFNGANYEYYVTNYNGRINLSGTIAFSRK